MAKLLILFLLLSVGAPGPIAEDADAPELSNEEMIRMYEETAQAIEELSQGSVDAAYLGRARDAVANSATDLPDGDLPEIDASGSVTDRDR